MDFMDRIIGIDYGDSRIGIAISDPMGLTAQGFETLYEKNQSKLIDKLKQIISQYNISKAVIGLPKNMDGTMGFRSEATLEFVENFKKHINIEVIMWDERLTTVAAHKLLNKTNVRGKKRKQIVDTVAASYILQGYLDSLR